jgi:hypothetical protein
VHENHSTVKALLRTKLLAAAAAMLLLVLLASSAVALDSLTLLATLVGENQHDEFYECASAGDVNGDGFNDIIVGAPQMMLDRGYAYIYFGGPGFDTVPDVRLIGEPFGPGGFSNFGCLVACAGDVNNDGYDDVLVSATFGFNYDIDWRTGKVFLYLGGAQMDSIEDVVFQGGDEDHDWFGSAISSAGDLNRDGFDDVIIGSPESPSGIWGFGRAYIYFGGENMDDQFDVCIQGDTGSYLGGCVKAVGDINSDGYDDILVAAPSDGPTHFEGRTSIYFGGNPMDTVPDVTFWGDSASFQHAGCYISSAGDVNGDNYPDVMIVGNYENKRLRIFYGGPFMDTIPDVLLGGSHAICSVGDLNKDGLGDIMVSGTIFFGGNPMDTLPDLSLPTGGIQVADAGDINADGYDEVLLSIYGDSTSRGVVFIFSSYASSVSDAEEEQLPKRFQLNQNYPTLSIPAHPFDTQYQARSMATRLIPLYESTIFADNWSELWWTKTCQPAPIRYFGTGMTAGEDRLPADRISTG